MDAPTIANPALLTAARMGLMAQPKGLSPKWLYDARGSEIFEAITDLPEYYPTRTEVGILCTHGDRLAGHVPAGGALVELGSGASVKTRLLLDRLPGLGAYLPLDISAEFLADTARSLDAAYPGLNVVPVTADFMAEIALPPPWDAAPKAAFFPGSTIGNLAPPDATALLARLRRWDGLEALILGTDLVKDEGTLVAAYDDAAGVTAAFNLNLLTRLNREANAGFDPDSFAHEARWNADAARIEMHLVSRVAQEVPLHTDMLRFAAGESIHTENSHKFTQGSVAAMAAEAGWLVSDWLTDANDWFAVSVLTPA